MNCVFKDIGGVVLIVSQFMLVVDMLCGNCFGFLMVVLLVEGECLYEMFKIEVVVLGILIVCG